MRTCGRGHTYTGDENYRARRGCCPVCFREVQKRYNRTAKGKARMASYERSEKAQSRYAKYRATDKWADALARYDQSPKGWLNALRKRRTNALNRRQRRKEAEDSSWPATEKRARKTSGGTGSADGSPGSSTSRSRTGAKKH